MAFISSRRANSWISGPTLQIELNIVASESSTLDFDAFANHFPDKCDSRNDREVTSSTKDPSFSAAAAIPPQARLK